MGSRGRKEPCYLGVEDSSEPLPWLLWAELSCLSFLVCKLGMMTMGLPLLELWRWNCEVVRIGKKSPKWPWLKDLEGKARENRTKKGPRTGVRTSGKTNNAPA